MSSGAEIKGTEDALAQEGHGRMHSTWVRARGGGGYLRRVLLLRRVYQEWVGFYPLPKYC